MSTEIDAAGHSSAHGPLRRLEASCPISLRSGASTPAVVVVDKQSGTSRQERARQEGGEE